MLINSSDRNITPAWANERQIATPATELDEPSAKPGTIVKSSPAETLPLSAEEFHSWTGDLPPRPAPSLPRSQSPNSQSPNSQSPHSADTPGELKALKQLAYQGEQQKRRMASIGRKPISTAAFEPTKSFASPLSSLRDRDLAVLEDLFVRQDINAIEADLTQMLLRLLPAPCWEEDPFEFLKEFL